MNEKFQFDHVQCSWIDGKGPEVKSFQELASSLPLCVCDLETTGLDPLENKISVIGIGFQSPTGTFSAFLFDQLVQDWTSLLRPLFENPLIFKVFHNAKFDWKCLFHHMGVDAFPLLDTIQAAQILNNGKAAAAGYYSLGGLSEHYLGLTLDKDPALRTSFTGGPYSERQIRYALMDLVATARLWNRLCDEMDPALQKIAALEGKVIAPTGAIELNGFRIDREKTQQLSIHIEDQLRQAHACMPVIGGIGSTADLKPPDSEFAAGARLNPNSPKQIKDYAHNRWKIALKGTNEKTLLSCRHPEAKVLFEQILRCRKLLKQKSTYLSRFQSLDQDGRLRGTFNALGAVSGRFSCSKPNLQNIPKTQEYRCLFVPDEGMQMIICDYSQIELRVAAELSEDEKMIEAFQSGEDLHALTASRMFEKPVAEITREERQRAKAVNFGLIYNMTPQGLVEKGASGDLKQATEFVEAFFTLYSAFKLFHNNLLIPALKEIRKGDVDFRTPRSGRRRWLCKKDLYWPGGGVRPNVVYNNPVQGLAGDGLKQALVILWPVLKPTGAKLLAVVHDEIVLEAPRREAQEVCRIVKTAMVEGMQVYLKKVPVCVDASIGESWAEKA